MTHELAWRRAAALRLLGQPVVAAMRRSPPLPFAPWP